MPSYQESNLLVRSYSVCRPSIPVG